MIGWRSCIYTSVGRDDVVRFRCADACHGVLTHRIVNQHPYELDRTSRASHSVLIYQKSNGEFESLAWTESAKENV
jgi:hypothetical protein